MKFLVALSALALFVPKLVDAHGMVVDPVNRCSMWRYGYPVEPNYEDNQQFCGGFQVQWEQNGGRCGLCGDDYALEAPRPAENTGIYGTGLPVGNYTAGDIIKITVRLTANHGGKFIFKLCPLADKTELETEECFDANVLELVSGGTEYIIPNLDIGEFVVEAILPENVTGDLVVLQCNYITASNWGWCDDEETVGAMGCGPQETYRTCSDITISAP